MSNPPLAPVGSLPAIPFHPFELESEIERLNKEFDNVVESLEDHLLESNVSVGKLQRAIKSIPISLKLQLGEYFLRQTSSIFKTESIPELMVLLSYFWDYFNPGLLQYFVGKFGSKDNIKYMDKYLRELKQFRMRVKIGEYLRAVPRQDDVCSHHFYKTIMTQMGPDWEKETLQDVEEYKIELSKELYIQTFLPRIQVIRSSIAIVFSIPRGIQINFVKLEPFFHYKGVIKVYLNGSSLIDWTKEVSGWVPLI